MIPTFNEYINEGRMGKLIDAAKKDTLRKEDVSIFRKQIEEMEWVDLGLPSGALWSSQELRDSNGDEFITYWEVKEEYKENNLFDFPYTTDIKDLYKYCDVSDFGDGGLKFTSKNNGKSIKFYTRMIHHFSGHLFGFKYIDGDENKYGCHAVWPCISLQGNPYFYYPLNAEQNVSKAMKKDTHNIFGSCAYLVRPVKHKL